MDMNTIYCELCHQHKPKEVMTEVSRGYSKGIKILIWACADCLKNRKSDHG